MRRAAILGTCFLVGCATRQVPVVHVGAPPPDSKILDTPFCEPPEPADALLLETQGFPSDPYQRGVAAVLLPEGSRVLDMVVMPSFEPEHAVYVETEPTGGCQVTKAVAAESVWHVGYDHWLDNQRPLPALPPARRQSRSISAATCQRLRALWDVALSGRKPPGPNSAFGADGSFCASIPIDGTNFHFRDRTSNGWRAGETPRGKAQPNVRALVALGKALARYPSTASDEQERLDAELGRQADDLADRFRRAAKATP